MSPRFSVILPVRNGERYIAEAVDSVLAQDFADFELLVLDNDSQDATSRIVGERAGRDARIRLLHSDRALGIEESWGRIHALCAGGAVRGEFLTLLGHDDRYDAKFLGTINRHLGRNPDAALFQTHFQIIDENGLALRQCKAMPYRESLGEFFTARCQHLRDSFGTGYCFRQQHYLECGGIPPYPRLMYADDMLWLRLLRYGDKITAPEFLFGYRHHPTSTSVEQNTERYRLTLKALRQFTEELARDFPDLVATESGAQALQSLIRPALVQIEKGAYRVGLDLNLIREDWAALATRLSADGRAPLQPRQRPFKRAWHALRRGLT